MGWNNPPVDWSEMERVLSGRPADGPSLQGRGNGTRKAIQGDANRDLADYPDGAFDYAVLSQTLQTAERPDLMLDELLRIGRKAFVSFPNFAHWRMRASLLWNGRMPVTRHLPVSWYETQNIHHVTVTDFRELLRAQGVAIEQSWFFSGETELSAIGANWRAEYAVYLLRR